jgi:lipoyl-dependent peroxiredoxin
MAKTVYTAAAFVTGGRIGHGASDDGILEVELQRPPEMGGTGEGTTRGNIDITLTANGQVLGAGLVEH